MYKYLVSLLTFGPPCKDEDCGYECHASTLYACNINKFHTFNNEHWKQKATIKHACEALRR
jgi:hypothetical protein